MAPHTPLLNDHNYKLSVLRVKKEQTQTNRSTLLQTEFKPFLLHTDSMKTDKMTKQKKSNCKNGINLECSELVILFHSLMFSIPPLTKQLMDALAIKSF